MRILYLIVCIICLSACSVKDDALYAPWNTAGDSNDSFYNKSASLSKLVSYKAAAKAPEVELCVTQLEYPHKQTCTKEEDA